MVGTTSHGSSNEGICERPHRRSCDGHFRPAPGGGQSALACAARRSRTDHYVTCTDHAGHALSATATLVQEGAASGLWDSTLNAACSDSVRSGHRRANGPRWVLPQGPGDRRRHHEPILDIMIEAPASCWRRRGRHAARSHGASVTPAPASYRFSGRVDGSGAEMRESAAAAACCRRPSKRSRSASITIHLQGQTVFQARASRHSRT